ncbi:hypothetical protein JOQ06_012768 [Pogonophryne albipinna]|uniref:HAT C-terminal dimerisation domain-containing protein n=1 Tax=Pogonophryne albipinna TaxID=1090488 RepID=A0AAD6BL59_9TELE|nr:hypothetical protein JOQ06_012768 [Pogonophryne albipinna]
MQTTILQMFKRKERDEETQNVLKIRKTMPTDDTVEAQREEEETQPEEVAAGPSEATEASVDGDIEPIAFPLDLSPKNMRQLSECAHNLDIALRRIGKVFSVRWVASSWRAVSAVWQSYPALAQHFRETSEDDTRDSRERAKFKGLLSKLCSINFLKSLALMADVLTELKNLSEILQNRKTTLPKAHDIMTTYVKCIESFNRYPGQHAVDASQAEEVMEFKGEELRVGRPVFAANRKEAYNSLINQMAVLNPDNWDHDNPRFGDNEVRALYDVLHVNQQEAHLGFTEYKASGGRNIPNKMKKLLMAVDTLSPSNADCERGFSTMNNIITEYRSKLTTKNAANLLFISSVGPPCRQWDPLPYVKTWLGKGRRAAHSTSCMARRYTEEESYFSPLWKMWKSV